MGQKLKTKIFAGILGIDLMVRNTYQNQIPLVRAAYQDYGRKKYRNFKEL